MRDGERPAGSDPPSAGRRGARRTRSALVPGLGDLARRLTALEREVEQALEGRVAPQDAPGSRLRGTLEDTVAGYARARRWLLRGEAPRDLGDAALRALYQYWWRVDAHGLDHVPARGRVVIATNRAGSLVPYDALMVAVAIERSIGRVAHPLVDEWLADLPLLGPVLTSLGALAATPPILRSLLERDEAAIVFPEGRAAAAKPFRERYRLRPFGGSTLLGVAIETGAPIVPVAVIGAEEVQPVLFRLPLAGRPFGVSALPVTPTLVPLPTHWTLYGGEPLDVAADYPSARARDARALRRLREQVRERLQGLVSEGLRRRRSIFRA